MKENLNRLRDLEEEDIERYCAYIGEKIELETNLTLQDHRSVTLMKSNNVIATLTYSLSNPNTLLFDIPNNISIYNSTCNYCDGIRLGIRNSIIPTAVQNMPKEDLNVVSEFLVMAATLLDIKCKMLLPKQETDEDEEEIDPTLPLDFLKSAA